MPGKPPNEKYIDFGIVFRFMLKPWLINSVQEYLQLSSSDGNLNNLIILVLSFSFNRYDIPVEEFAKYPKIKEFLEDPD